MKLNFAIFAALALIGTTACSSTSPLEKNSPSSVNQMKLEQAPVSRKLQQLNSRTVLAASDEEAVRNGANIYAHRMSKLENEAEKINRKDIAAILKAKKKKQPVVHSVRLSDYEEFNKIRAAVNGKKLKVDNFPVWIVEYEGDFYPVARSLKKSKASVSRVVVAYNQSGDLVSRLELTADRWMAAKAKL